MSIKVKAVERNVSFDKNVEKWAFTPNVDIKEELARTSVSITCYDRNRNIVKRITSTDEGNVEDPENPTPGGGDENEGPDII